MPWDKRIRLDQYLRNSVMKKLLAVIGSVSLSISSYGTILLNETFSYADGNLTNVSAGLWRYHSGGGTPSTALSNINGRAFINQNDFASGLGDANRLLSSSLDPTNDNTSVLYSSFTVNFSDLPSRTGTNITGSYFAHYRANSGEFYSRVGATTFGAAPGTFRINVGNEAAFGILADPVIYPVDLTLNTTYTIVTRLSFATDQTTLWINPTSELDFSVTATDAISYLGQITGYALRQGVSGATGSPGDIYVDDLIVGTTFLDVAPPVPEPSIITLAGLGMWIFANYRRRN